MVRGGGTSAGHQTRPWRLFWLQILLGLLVTRILIKQIEPFIAVLFKARCRCLILAANGSSLCFSHGWFPIHQVPCDSDCLDDRCLSGFDNRIRDIRLALGCVNGLTGRFARIYSTSKPDIGTIPDVHSYRSACNDSNTDSYTDTDAVTKSSAYAGAPSDSSTPPPIAAWRKLALRIVSSMRARAQFRDVT